MIRLSIEEENAVRLAQLGAAAADRYGPRWRTRHYTVLRPLAGGGLRLVLAAARRAQEIRGVASWRVGDRVWASESCLDWRGMAGWVTKWSVPPDKGASADSRHCLRDRGTLAPRWAWAPLVNPGAAADTPWEYLARAAAGGRVDPKALPRYFLLGRRFPRVELLARAGFPEEWLNGNILAKMRDDADFGRYAAANAETIAERALLPSDVIPAWRGGWTIERAAAEAELRTKWHGLGLYGVDRHEAERYVERLEREAAEAGGGGCLGRILLTVSRMDYSRYLDLARKAGRDLRERGVAFPRDFFAARDAVEREKRRAEEAHLRAIREEERKRAAEERKRREALRKELPGRLRMAAAFAAAALERLPLPEGWRVRPLRTVAEFREEGKRMHNCIGGGGYAEKVAEGKAVCFVLEGPTRQERHDLELALGPSPRVVQLYGVCNRPAAAVAVEIAGHVAGAVRRALKKTRKPRKELEESA